MYENRASLYEEIESFTQSKSICYVTGDRLNLGIQIAPDVLEHLADHLDSIGITQRISLILCSRGGNTLAGWSIVNLIKQFCKELVVVIPSRAHSTATLITLGANRIIMTKQATLGPIDPSINGPLNPQSPGQNPQSRVPVSVESINGYFEFAKSIGIKSNADTAKLVLDLADRVHPLVLGDVYRSRAQIRMIGKRLLSAHIKDASKINKILEFLCSESGSHDYTINRREARDELGLNIDKPDDTQYNTLRNLHRDYTNELELMTPYDPNLYLGQDTQKEYTFVRGLIESRSGGSTRFVSKGVIRRLEVQPQGQVIEDRRTFEGWINE